MNLLARFEARLKEHDIYVSMLGVYGPAIVLQLVRERAPDPPADGGLHVHMPGHSGNPEISVDLNDDEGEPIIRFAQGGPWEPFDLEAAARRIDGMLPPLSPKAGAS